MGHAFVSMIKVNSSFRKKIYAVIIELQHHPPTLQESDALNVTITADEVRSRPEHVQVLHQHI